MLHNTNVPGKASLSFHRSATVPATGCTSRFVAGLLATAMFASNASAQSGETGVFCEGTGRLIGSQVTVTGMGQTMTGGQSVDSPVSVSVTDCGRRIVLDAPEIHVELLRSDFDDSTVEGVYTADGIPAQWTLKQFTPTLLSGGATAQSKGMHLRYDISVSLSEARAPNLDGCFKDGTEMGGSSASSARDALAKALSNGERQPPDGYSARDFVSSPRAGKSSAEHVHVLLSEDKTILPPDVHSQSLEDICSGKNGQFEPPRFLLNYKIVRLDADTSVFVQMIDIETGVIQEQREGVAEGTDAGSVSIAMAQATAKLSSGPGGFSDGKR